jgi:hypothetical protein
VQPSDFLVVDQCDAQAAQRAMVKGNRDGPLDMSLGKADVSGRKVNVNTLLATFV